MPIQVENTAIPEVKILIAKKFPDDRGFFMETYKEQEYLEIGLPKFVQDNLSESSKGVIRGLHWQEPPYGQGKLVSCLSGSILDVAVDIRRESKTYGKYVAVELSGKDQYSLWIPTGFAHGFQSLQDQTLVHYKVTNYWNSNSESSLNPLDANLGIKWIDIPVIMSLKDRESSGFIKP